MDWYDEACTAILLLMDEPPPIVEDTNQHSLIHIPEYACFWEARKLASRMEGIEARSVGWFNFLRWFRKQAALSSRAPLQPL